MRFVFLLLPVVCTHAQTLSNGTPPLTPPSYRYNDQYASLGRSTSGDSGYIAWASNGNVYRLFGDAYGFAQGTPGGCNNGNGGASLIVGVYSGSAPYLNGSNVNCLVAMGESAQTDTGGWTDGRSWKGTGLIDIEDGSATPQGLYYFAARAAVMPTYNQSNQSVMYSPDHGATWCNPAHCPSTDANGDPPAANTSEFSDTNLSTFAFVQYEQGSTGIVTTDGNDIYIYCMVTDQAIGKVILMRAARGSNLQTSSSWQFYTGSIGGSVSASANWSSSSSGATTLISSPMWNDQQVIWIAQYGYLYTSGDGSNDLVFRTARTLSGPWTQILSESLIASVYYEYPVPDLSSIVYSDARITVNIGFNGGPNLISPNPALSQYSQFWRQLTIFGAFGSVMTGSLSLSGGASIQ